MKIYKEWVVVSANPCKYCRGMNGRRVNVTESYVKKGGILIGKSKIRVNDYADIDTAGAHPNCSCVEKFGIEENNNEPWRSVEIEELPAKKFSEVYGKDWKGFSFDRNEPLNKREKEVAQILSHNLDTKVHSLRRVEKPNGIKTPDLIIDKTKADIKSVSSLRAIEKASSKIAKQTGEGGIAVFDLKELFETEEKIIKKAQFETSIRNLEFYVILGDKIIKK